MNHIVMLGLAVALGVAAGSALAADKGFEENYAKARSNVAAPVGAAYDNKLGLVLQTTPEFQQRFKDCAQRYPGKQAVHGYFSFGSATSYKVVLEPRSAFSGCLTHALEGHRVPPPPRLPYFIPFDLSTKPAGK